MTGHFFPCNSFDIITVYAYFNSQLFSYLTLSAWDAYIYAQKSPTLHRGMHIYMHTESTLLSRVFLLTLHTAEVFIALISFYELRTSRIKYNGRG